MQTNLRARAKVNLCLHVTGQRADGYHLLDSLVVFADVSDAISPFGDVLSDEPNNLILRAAGCFSGDFEIHLQKNLPVASGIGGGSADAAATLRGIAQLTGAELPADRGVALGADVPVCLAGAACRMSGIGEDITPVKFLPPLPAILVWPNSSVSTPDVFNTLQSKENAPIGTLPKEALPYSRVIEFLSQTRNDLERPAREVAPAVGDALGALKNAGADFARMSGSGATCFGLFSTLRDAQIAGDAIRKTYPDWWVQPTLLNQADQTTRDTT